MTERPGTPAQQAADHAVDVFVDELEAKGLKLVAVALLAHVDDKGLGCFHGDGLESASETLAFLLDATRRVADQMGVEIRVIPMRGEG